ncbi:MAG: (5-formylfuran-3-yl)methyl phosphate synthase [Promethearchaeota archaeon]
MKLLVSPNSIEGARQAITGGADIIDCKNPREGSLGANFPWIIEGMRKLVLESGHRGIKMSATLGDMPFLPGTASLAATGLASLGVDYVKIGVFGPSTVAQARDLLSNVVKSVKRVDESIRVVAAGYADQRRLNASMPPMEIIDAASESGCDVVMVDTSIKDEKSLLDFMNVDEIHAFCDAGKSRGMDVALAGKLRMEDIPILKETKADIIGVRSLVCKGMDRVLGTVDATLVSNLKLAIQ